MDTSRHQRPSLHLNDDPRRGLRINSLLNPQAAPFGLLQPDVQPTSQQPIRLPLPPPPPLPQYQYRGLGPPNFNSASPNPPLYHPRQGTWSLPPIMNPSPTGHHMTHYGWTASDVDSHGRDVVNDDARYIYSDQVNSLPRPAEMARASDAAIPNKKRCQICLEVSDEKEFVFKCINCRDGYFCAECLGKWFLDACRNETKMPPKCCSIIPVKSVSGILSDAEIEHFKAKLEEWSTPNRLYCPIPTCSTFIHPRLYVEKFVPQPEWTVQRSWPIEQESVAPSPANSTSQERVVEPAKTRKPNVSCPACGFSVCTKCRALTHVGECPTSDLDAELEQQLKKWKIKRCPKCRTGVRKVYGCGHIQCLCGAHFCWECLLPIQQCDGSCDDRSEYGPDDELDENDLDGRAGFFDGDGHQFGPEPYDYDIDTWGCDHQWRRPTNLEEESFVGPLECHECFAAFEKSPKQTENVQKIGESSVPAPTDLGPVDRASWECFSGHAKCKSCPKALPSWSRRHGDVSRLWDCDCGAVKCVECDRQEAQESWARERAAARKEIWRCSRCSIIVCGICKEAEFPGHS